jgi:hypothetical protein
MEMMCSDGDLFYHFTRMFPFNHCILGLCTEALVNCHSKDIMNNFRSGLESLKTRGIIPHLKRSSEYIILKQYSLYTAESIKVHHLVNCRNQSSSLSSCKMFTMNTQNVKDCEIKMYYRNRWNSSIP